MKKQSKEVTVVLCDNLIKLHLRGYSKNEVTEVFHITPATYDDCVATIQERYGINLQKLQMSLNLKIP